MGKIKLLFDVEQLSESGLKGHGVVRVGSVLFEKLLKCPDIDLYPVLTTRRGDFDAYLKAKGLYKQLKGKIVRMPQLRNSTKNLTWHHRVKSCLLTLLLRRKYIKRLSQYDAYFSLFSPISPIVYDSHIKTFYMVHDLIPLAYPDGCSAKFCKNFKDWVYRLNADVYFTDSDYTGQDFIKYKKDVDTSKLHTLYLGAEDSFTPISDTQLIDQVKSKYHIPTKSYFLAVSEITKRKNLVHLLRAYVQFIKQTGAQDISLVMVGPVRPGYEDVANSVEGLGEYKDKIIQTGFVADEDLPVLYNGAMAFAYPSLYEGFGLPVLEAMQCGTPVVTCDNTSLPEVGGEAVLYVKGNDVNETAEVLNKLYTDTALRESMSQKGLIQAKKFSWDKMADGFVNILKTEVRKKTDEN